MLLALDSSAGTGAALLADDGTLLAERIETDTLRHAEVVGELIAGVLADAGATAADVTAVAVGVGPGPFTGLRVGMAAARAFALAAGVPVEGIVSHDALALSGSASPTAASSPPPGGAAHRIVVTDARRRERYWSRYSGLDASGLPVRTAGPSLAKPDEVPRDAPRLEDGVVSPGAIGILAVRRRAAGLPAAPLDPLYLRSPDVTLSAPKRVAW
ncbi:MAG: molecular chaperone [Naasia sp.]|nr:molecular chaperone [Naasia sp.]